MDWNPWFTWSGLDKFKTVFIPIIHNNLYAGSNGLRPREKKKDLHSISMDQSFVGYHKFQNPYGQLHTRPKLSIL